MTTIVDVVRVDAQGSTFNTVIGDQHNVNTYNITNVESVSASSGSLPTFIEAPIDLLSIYFTGRRKEMELITQAFSRPHNSIPLRCVLFGDQGVGKTQLTYKWAKSTFSGGENQYVIWMSATTVEKVDQGLSKILHLINHPDRFRSEQMVRLMAARRWLEEVDSGNWLLVLDNVFPETVRFLQEHLPRKNGRGSILFTTRTWNVAVTLASVAGDQHEIVQVPMLKVQEGAELFYGHFRDGEIDLPPDKVEQIVKSVGCLPLAISHAAAYMQQSASTVDELFASYQGKSKIHAISWQNSLSDYEHKSVAATFESQLEDLEQRFPDASNLLKMLAYFDPESIPLDMLVKGATAILGSRPTSPTNTLTAVRKSQSILRRIKVKALRLGASNGKGRVDEMNILPSLPFEMTSLLTIIQSPTELRNAITVLLARCLTAYQDSSCSILRIHDLIQLVILEKTKQSGTHQQWFECAVELACEVFQQIEDPGSPSSWPQCETLIPHIQSLTTRQEISDKVKAQLLDLNSQFSWYLRSRGRYGEAEELYVRVLADEEQVFGSEDPRTLETVHRLGCVYQEQGRFGEAEALFKRVLQARNKLLGSEHVNTLGTMYMLAYVYSSQKRYKESEELLEKVLQAREKLLGSEHIYTLNTKHLLAVIYYNQNRSNDAKTLFKQVLQSMEEHFGPDHIDSAWTINYLALVYHSQGHHRHAEELFEQVLRIWDKQLGYNHPNTLMAKHNLALVYTSQGRYNEAEELLMYVLTHREKVLGHFHPYTRRTMNSLARVYEKLGRPDDAAIVRRRADQQC